MKFNTSNIVESHRHPARLGSLVLLASGLAFAGLGSNPASADPRNGDVLELACNTLGTVEVTVFSNGAPSPGLVADTNRVIVPYELLLVTTVTPSDGTAPQTFTEGFVKPPPRNHRTDHCTFDDAFSGSFGSFELHGEVSISYTPANRIG